MAHRNGDKLETNGQNEFHNDSGYSFPDSKLKTTLKDSSKTPLVLVACGSFSPITYLHLRMFEMASDFVRLHTRFEVVGGYLSPVSDAYKKAGLAVAEHR
jgi:nicotinamide mononucleotide adenylyltransferase